MDLLNSLVRDDKNFANILHSLKEENKNVYISGLSDSSKNFFEGYLADKIDKPVLLLTYNDMQAKVIAEDLQFFLNPDQKRKDVNIHVLISRPHLLYNVDAGTQDIFSNRQEAIISAIKDKNTIIVCSIEAFITRLIPKKEYVKNIISLKVGESVSIDNLIKSFVDAGYNVVDAVSGKGQVSKKGGIVDIFALNHGNGFRIEFFDDEIDSIRLFDIETQRSIENLSNVEIFPARELLYTDIERAKAYELLSKDVNELGKSIKRGSSDNHILEKFNYVLEMIKNNMHIDGVEKYAGYFYNKLETIIDYMPEDTLVFIDEPNRIKQRYDNIRLEFDEMIKSLIEKKQFLSKYYDLVCSYEDVLSLVNLRKHVIINYMEQQVKDFLFDERFNFEFNTINSFQGRINDLVSKLKDNINKNYLSFIICSTEAQAERLKEEFENYDIGTFIAKNNIMSENEAQSDQIAGYSNKVIVLLGGIHKGFEYKFVRTKKADNKDSINGFCILNYSDIFGGTYKNKNRKKVKKSERLKSFTELKVGDYVVHVNHGIGTYTGIEQLVIDNVTKDYLKIIYSGGDSLYVPTNQLDMIQKYVGVGDKEPKLNKLGGSEWIKVKNRVKKSVEDIAEGLVELYAQRQATKGFKFSDDSVWQNQFEDMFPYQETDDQLQSIKEIKEDMTSDKVMDRLLCGDVGYGKTEVAMRAAFKAVQDNKQVAYLVPTTVLAHQHYMNFLTRFKEFPINIEVLSRFKSAAQQKQAIQKTKVGDVDVLIGTHRLLQKDIKFKDLGLIIIDEEQRFGVKHKEKLKELKKDVDVLTLTATPIPRTLHMSMVGIRDISIIEEPPEERQPVQTYVMEYDDELIKDAIIREMARGGQVFYVYNRVESIDSCAGKIKRMLPECRVSTVHGQMTPGQLEDRIMEFIEGEFDVLVCTTIIETGIDMPNVNTLIVENADHMGLSQLYQLRGRVGRSNKLAYAYFTYKRDKMLTEVSEKRLQAIKEFTEFGSGFKIALRDLEIRGAGNLLGAEQHGHMEAVGYDMYCHLLDEAVKRLQGKKVTEQLDTTIDIAVDAYIPSYYIKDEIQKIEMYKKVAAIDSEGDVILLQEEFTDRFGDMPHSVLNLIQIAYIKYLCRLLSIDSIVQRKDVLTIQFVNADIFDETMVNKIIKKFGNNNKLTFEPTKKPTIKVKVPGLKGEAILLNVNKVLKFLSNKES